jgi:hypothetical protein
MTDDNDLVKRLRLKRERCHDLSGVYYTEDADCQAAADRIEALTEQLEPARLDAKEAEAYSVWLEGELAKVAAAFHANFIVKSDTHAHKAFGVGLAELKGDKP